MTFGSLFAGIGGMDLGLDRAGMRCAWQVEINPWCRSVLAKHWPAVHRHDDVRTFPDGNPEAFKVDVIAGGFPCQDISTAGNRSERKGTDGERSGLWSEFARVVRLLRPRVVIVENVSALLARGLSRVLADLAESGYDAEWDCLYAATAGLPHRRERLFIVAYPNGEQRPQQDFRADQPRVFAPRWDYSAGLALAQVRADEAEARFRGMDDGASRRLDRTTALGNAVCPAVAEWIGRRVIAARLLG